MVPLGLLHMLVGVGLAVHAMRTGRPSYWFSLLILVPFAGSVAYFLFEILPEMARTRRAQQVAADLRTVANPDASYRARVREAEQVDSVDAKRALAEECAGRGMWEDAVRLYRAAATGLYANDPPLLLGLAAAELGAGRPTEAQAVLERLRAAHPALHSPEGHLTYARSLEAQGALEAAQREYAALVTYNVGTEARTRYGLLLQRLGHPAEARTAFQAALDAAAASRLPLTPDDRDWQRVARRNLEA